MEMSIDSNEFEFAVGDVVVWDLAFCARQGTLHETHNKVLYGDGPFTVFQTAVPGTFAERSGAGHSQFVWAKTPDGRVLEKFSGAWFKKA